MRKTKHLYDILSEAETEDEVRYLFANFYSKRLPIKFSTKKKVDMYTPQILFEFKLDANLKNVRERAKCVAQTLYYIRRLKFGNDERPLSQNICVVTKKFAVFYPTETFAEFYEKNSYDWDLRPSSPCKNLVNDLAASENIRTNVYEFEFPSSEIAFSSLIEETIKRNYDSSVKKQINEQNFYQIFRLWQHLFGDAVENGRKASEYFITDIEEGKTSFVDNSSVLFRMTSGDLVEKFLNPDAYRNFWNTYEKISSAREIVAIRQKMDRLTEINLRRYTGEFYTPLNFADKAIEYLGRVVGENWFRDGNFRLWDMAAGTGNLEFDLPVDALKFCYISTLLDDDADYCKKLFPTATVFQYDYLNDGAEKLPKNICRHARLVSRRR